MTAIKSCTALGVSAYVLELRLSMGQTAKRMARMSKPMHD